MSLFDFFKSRKPRSNRCDETSCDDESASIPGICDSPLNAKYTPENITSLGKRDIFVFGSNLAGHHAGGAAKVAFNRFGAVWGQGEGLQGNSYAIPTMQGGVESIKPYVDRFIEFAEYEKALTFYVTKIGCGIAGFTIKDIAPLFRNAYNLPNVILPIEFSYYIEKEHRTLHHQMTPDTVEATHAARVRNRETPIKIVGIGGGGCNAVGRMFENPYVLAEYAIISDSACKVQKSKVPTQLLLRDSDPCTVKNICSQEAFNHYYAEREENADFLHSMFDETVKQMILVSGFGGGFGTFCTKWLASMSKRVNIPVFLVCTIPFEFEGQRKQQMALDAVRELIEDGIAVKTIKADTVTEMHNDISFVNCFSLLDEYVADTVHKLCKELLISSDNTKETAAATVNDKKCCEITTHCYGMTRTFADIILGLNEEKRYTSPDQALSDLGAYLQRFKEQGDDIAFISIRILQNILHGDSEIFANGILNVSRLREIVFEYETFLPAYDKAYDFYCREKLVNLVAYLNEFRRYSNPEELRTDLFHNTDVLKFSHCSPNQEFYYFLMGGATAMDYPVQFFVRAIRELWSSITTDGILDAQKMRNVMFGNHEESIRQYGFEETIKRDFVSDSPCHPEVFVPKTMGTAPIYVKEEDAGRYIRSCGEGKGPNAIPDWLEFQIAKQILENDKSYKLIGSYYIPKYDNTLPVYGEYSGRLVFNTQEEKIKFIEDVKHGKRIWR